MTTLIAYARFSDRPNAKDCESIEAQQSLIEAWATQHKHTIRAWHADAAVSGADRGRKGLQDAIDDCRRGESLVVYDWSRLGRDVWKSLSVFEQLRAKRCGLVSVVEGPFANPDDPTCKLMATIFGAFAEYNRSTSAQRTSKQMRRRQANGDRMSKIPPYGWRAEGAKLIEDEAEQRIIGSIRGWRQEGLSLREICGRCSVAFGPCRGNGWHHSLIASILRRAKA